VLVQGRSTNGRLGNGGRGGYSPSEGRRLGVLFAADKRDVCRCVLCLPQIRGRRLGGCTKEEVLVFLVFSVHCIRAFEKNECTWTLSMWPTGPHRGTEGPRDLDR